MGFVGILAVCAYKTVVGMVEHIQESCVQGQSGTEDGAQHDTVLRQTDACRAQGGSHFALFVGQRLAHFICHHFAYACYVVAE